MKKINFSKFPLILSKNQNQLFLFELEVISPTKCQELRFVYTRELSGLLGIKLVKIRVLCREYTGEQIRELFFNIKNHWRWQKFKSPVHMFYTERKRLNQLKK